MMNLKYILLISLLMPYCAMAGWVELAADTLAREYVNLETVERQGNVISMWNMSDFNAPQAVGNGQVFLSTKVLQEYDCLVQKKRIMTLIHYQNSMGGGPLVFYDKTSGPWRAVAAGSLGEVHLNAACLASLNQPKPIEAAD